MGCSADLLLGDEGVVEHDCRVVVKHQFPADRGFRFLLNGIPIDFGVSIVFLALFSEMQVLLYQRIPPGEGPLAPQLRIALPVLTVGNQLHILVCGVAEAKINEDLNDLPSAK